MGETRDRELSNKKKSNQNIVSASRNLDLRARKSIFPIQKEPKMIQIGAKSAPNHLSPQGGAQTTSTELVNPRIDVPQQLRVQ